MINDEFIAAIKQLADKCRSTAAANPELREIWIDRAEALESLIESEAAPAIAFRATTTTTTTSGGGTIRRNGK